MEDLINIIIYLFIIYLFLSPLFKKKPKSRPVETKPDYEEQILVDDEKSEEISSQNILKEIELLFGRSTESDEAVKEEKIEEEEQKQFESKIYDFKTEEKVEVKTLHKEIIEKDFAIEEYNYEETSNNYEIDEFDYTKIDEESLDTSKEAKKVELERTFSIRLQNIDDFKKAFIYKEVFESPLTMRILGLKWRRSIY